MLTHLSIRNFTLVEHIELELEGGMTAITGETGTGKSIVLDALGIALGDRTDADRVRRSADKADISATFNLQTEKQAQQWLNKRELACGDECILRRVITKEGRSRAYINGQTVTRPQLRELGDLLIGMHSQHAHQSLLKKEAHRRLVDEFVQQQETAQDVKHCFHQWQQAEQQFISTRDNADAISARYQLLRYQVDELELLEITAGELATLEQEQQTLANAESILHSSHQLAEICDGEDHSLYHHLNRALQLIVEMPTGSTALNNAQQLLNSALIQVEEATSEVRSHIDSVELNPERLQSVEERLSTIYQIARKHRINPDELPQLQQRLSEELAQLSGGDEQLAQLEAAAQKAESVFYKHAKKLSRQRQKAAKQLTSDVNQQLQSLAMGNARFVIELTSLNNKPSAHGLEDIEFLISTNPGHPPRALGKVASGGELSRISLAIQVATAKTSSIPTLIFDEVDVGIGGATADIVGRLLADLSIKSQILCVTHLAQVASKANQHWQVSKEIGKTTAATHINTLSGKHQIEEIARMISGDQLTKQSLAHARQMLQSGLH